jgi:dehydrogenase/reductase SDR family member 12
MYAEKLDVDRLESPRGYRPAQAYARAKRAQVVLTHEWGQRLHGHGVHFHVAHPGWALTPGVEASLPRFRTVTGPILRDPHEGADTIVWLASRTRSAATVSCGTTGTSATSTRCRGPVPTRARRRGCGTG